MKNFLKLFAAMLVVCVMAAATADAAVRRGRTWNLSLPRSGVSDPGFADGTISGVSDPDLSSASSFCIDGQSGVSAIDLSGYEFDTLFLQVGTLNVLSEATPAYTNTTATFGVYWQQSETESGLATAEKRPLFIAKDITSGSTPWVVSVDTPVARYAKFMFESDCTAWATAGVSVFFARAKPGQVFEPVKVGGTTTYELNANSGVSSIDTVPEGTRRTVVTVKGSDIYYSVDASTPNASYGQVLKESHEPLVILGYQQARNFYFRSSLSGTGTSVFVTHYDR